MKRLLRWFGIALAGIVGLALVAWLVVYVKSERELRREWPVPATAALEVPTDAGSIAEGRRLAVIRGCFAGCHGKEAEGGVMIDEPLVGRLVAPDLTEAVHRLSDAELMAAIRDGVRPDGRGLVVMPSNTFAMLTDADLGRIVAFLRSLPPAHGPTSDMSLGPLGRIGFATGQFKTEPRLLAEHRLPPEGDGDVAARGRYLAVTVCGHCHEPDLHGTSNPDFKAPNLIIVSAYSPEQFKTLLKTGSAMGGREVGLMSAVARDNLSHLTDDEIAALYAYLHSLPALESR